MPFLSNRAVDLVTETGETETTSRPELCRAVAADEDLRVDV